MNKYKFEDSQTGKSKRVYIQHTEDDITVTLPDESGKLLTTNNLDLIKEKSKEFSSQYDFILKPDIEEVYPDRTTTDRNIKISTYRTTSYFQEDHKFTEWQAYDPTKDRLLDFTKDVRFKDSWYPEVSTKDLGKECKIRYRFYSDDVVSPWSDYITVPELQRRINKLLHVDESVFPPVLEWSKFDDVMDPVINHNGIKIIVNDKLLYSVPNVNTNAFIYNREIPTNVLNTIDFTNKDTDPYSKKENNVSIEYTNGKETITDSLRFYNYGFKLVGDNPIYFNPDKNTLDIKANDIKVATVNNIDVNKGILYHNKGYLVYKCDIDIVKDDKVLKTIEDFSIDYSKVEEEQTVIDINNLVLDYNLDVNDKLRFDIRLKTVLSDSNYELVFKLPSIHYIVLKPKIVNITKLEAFDYYLEKEEPYRKATSSFMRSKENTQPVIVYTLDDNLKMDKLPDTLVISFRHANLFPSSNSEWIYTYQLSQHFGFYYGGKTVKDNIKNLELKKDFLKQDAVFSNLMEKDDILFKFNIKEGLDKGNIVIKDNKLYLYIDIDTYKNMLNAPILVNTLNSDRMSELRDKDSVKYNEEFKNKYKDTYNEKELNERLTRSGDLQLFGIRSYFIQNQFHSNEEQCYLVSSIGNLVERRIDQHPELFHGYTEFNKFPIDYNVFYDIYFKDNELDIMGNKLDSNTMDMFNLFSAKSYRWNSYDIYYNMRLPIASTNVKIEQNNFIDSLDNVFKFKLHIDIDMYRAVTDYQDSFELLKELYKVGHTDDRDTRDKIEKRRSELQDDTLTITKLTRDELYNVFPKWLKITGIVFCIKTIGDGLEDKKDIPNNVIKKINNKDYFNFNNETYQKMDGYYTGILIPYKSDNISIDTDGKISNIILDIDSNTINNAISYRYLSEVCVAYIETNLGVISCCTFDMLTSLYNLTQSKLDNSRYGNLKLFTTYFKENSYSTYNDLLLKNKSLVKPGFDLDNRSPNLVETNGEKINIQSNDNKELILSFKIPANDPYIDNSTINNNNDTFKYMFTYYNRINNSDRKITDIHIVIVDKDTNKTIFTTDLDYFNTTIDNEGNRVFNLKVIDSVDKKDMINRALEVNICYSTVADYSNSTKVNIVHVVELPVLDDNLKTILETSKVPFKIQMVSMNDMDNGLRDVESIIYDNPIDTNNIDYTEYRLNEVFTKGMRTTYRETMEAFDLLQVSNTINVSFGTEDIIAKITNGDYNSLGEIIYGHMQLSKFNSILEMPIKIEDTEHITTYTNSYPELLKLYSINMQNCFIYNLDHKFILRPSNNIYVIYDTGEFKKIDTGVLGLDFRELGNEFSLKIPTQEEVDNINKSRERPIRFNIELEEYLEEHTTIDNIKDNKSFIDKIKEVCNLAEYSMIILEFKYLLLTTGNQKQGTYVDVTEELEKHTGVKHYPFYMCIQVGDTMNPVFATNDISKGYSLQYDINNYKQQVESECHPIVKDNNTEYKDIYDVTYLSDSTILNTYAYDSKYIFNNKYRINYLHKYGDPDLNYDNPSYDFIRYGFINSAYNGIGTEEFVYPYFAKEKDKNYQLNNKHGHFDTVEYLRTTDPLLKIANPLYYIVKDYDLTLLNKTDVKPIINTFYYNKNNAICNSNFIGINLVSRDPCVNRQDMLDITDTKYPIYVNSKILNPNLVNFKVDIAKLMGFERSPELDNNVSYSGVSVATDIIELRHNILLYNSSEKYEEYRKDLITLRDMEYDRNNPDLAQYGRGIIDSLDPYLTNKRMMLRYELPKAINDMVLIKKDDPVSFTDVNKFLQSIVYLYPTFEIKSINSLTMRDSIATIYPEYKNGRRRYYDDRRPYYDVIDNIDNHWLDNYCLRRDNQFRDKMLWDPGLMYRYHIAVQDNKTPYPTDDYILSYLFFFTKVNITKFKLFSYLKEHDYKIIDLCLLHHNDTTFNHPGKVYKRFRWPLEGYTLYTNRFGIKDINFNIDVNEKGAVSSKFIYKDNNDTQKEFIIKTDKENTKFDGNIDYFNILTHNKIAIPPNVTSLNDIREYLVSLLNTSLVDYDPNIKYTVIDVKFDNTDDPTIVDGAILRPIYKNVDTGDIINANVNIAKPKLIGKDLRLFSRPTWSAVGGNSAPYGNSGVDNLTYQVDGMAISVPKGRRFEIYRNIPKETYIRAGYFDLSKFKDKFDNDRIKYAIPIGYIRLFNLHKDGKSHIQLGRGYNTIKVYNTSDNINYEKPIETRDVNFLGYDIKFSHGQSFAIRVNYYIDFENNKDIEINDKYHTWLVFDVVNELPEGFVAEDEDIFFKYNRIIDLHVKDKDDVTDEEINKLSIKDTGMVIPSYLDKNDPTNVYYIDNIRFFTYKGSGDDNYNTRAAIYFNVIRRNPDGTTTVHYGHGWNHGEPDSYAEIGNDGTYVGININKIEYKLGDPEIHNKEENNDIYTVEFHINETNKKAKLDNNNTWQDTGVFLPNYEFLKDSYGIKCKDVNGADVKVDIRDRHIWLYVTDKNSDAVTISIYSDYLPGGKKDINIELPSKKPEPEKPNVEQPEEGEKEITTENTLYGLALLSHSRNNNINDPMYLNYKDYTAIKIKNRFNITPVKDKLYKEVGYLAFDNFKTTSDTISFRIRSDKIYLVNIWESDKKQWLIFKDSINIYKTKEDYINKNVYDRTDMLTERNILPGYYIGLTIEKQYNFETQTHSPYTHDVELIIQVVNTLPKENEYFEYPFFQYPKGDLLNMVEGDNRTVEANIDRSLVDDGSKDKIFVDGLEFKLDTDPDQPIAVFLFGLKYRDKNGVVSTLMSKSTTYFRYLEPDENFISLPIKVKKKREPEPGPNPVLPGYEPEPNPNPEPSPNPSPDPGDKPDDEPDGMLYNVTVLSYSNLNSGIHPYYYNNKDYNAITFEEQFNVTPTKDKLYIRNGFLSLDKFYTREGSVKLEISTDALVLANIWRSKSISPKHWLTFKKYFNIYNNEEDFNNRKISKQVELLTQEHTTVGSYIGITIDKEYDFTTQTYNEYKHDVEIVIEVVNDLPGDEDDYFCHPFFAIGPGYTNPEEIADEIKNNGYSDEIEYCINPFLYNDEKENDKIFVDDIEVKLTKYEAELIILFSLKYRDKNGVVSTILPKATSDVNNLLPTDTYLSFIVKS